MGAEDKDQLIADIVAALKASAPVLSEEEVSWVKLAIAKEAQSIRLRQAVIEKTLAALLWAAIVALGTVVWTGIKTWAKGNL